MKRDGRFKLLLLAFKNLGRHKTKTVLTVTAITIGIALYIWMDSWLLGMNLDSRRNLINFETGSAKIYSKAYFEKKDELPMYETFFNYAEIIKKLDLAGYYASPRAVFTGTLLSKDTELPFVFIGVEPEKEKKVLSYYKYIEPPKEITKEEFESKILSKIGDSSSKSLLNEYYEFDEKNSLYRFRDANIDADNRVIQIKEKIKTLEEKKRVSNIDGKLKSYDKKLDNLNRELRGRIRILEREYLEKISKVLRSIEYYNFVKNGHFEILLGSKGATDLKVKAGDSINCSVTIDKKDEKGRVRQIHQLINFKVVGIVNSPNPKTNGYVGYVPLDILNDDKGLMLEGGITEISIRKKDAREDILPGKDESPSFIKRAIGGELSPNLVLVGWEEDAKDYLAMSTQDIVTTYIMIGILFVLAVMGIANTMLMAIFERTKEIGMLRAIGMRDLDIIRLFLYEAGFIGVIGSLIGVFFGIILDYWVIYYGIDYTNVLAETNVQDFGYRIIGIFKGAWNIHTIIVSPIVATIIASLAAVLPAIKAVKMSIVDALRFE